MFLENFAKRQVIANVPRFQPGRKLAKGDARRWPARNRRPLGYSSPLYSRRHWRSQPMNHPITNAANRNVMITPMLTNT